jgi:hypothetical protein
MQADPGTADRTVLEAIQTVENSEFGGFFLSQKEMQPSTQEPQ